MLISVIMPVYNAEKYLEESVSSILNQTYKNIELILVNDGSTDNSIEICKRFEDLDSRVKYFEKENSGAGATRNFGLSRSTGEIISFIDSDDYVDSKMFENMLSYLLDKKLDMVMCETCNFYGNHKFIKQKLESGVYSSDEMIKKFLSDRITTSTCDKIYRREIFKNINIFPVGKIGEDHLALYRLIKSSEKIGVLSEAYYFYRQDDKNSVTKKELTDKVLDIFDIKNEIIKDIHLKYGEKYNSYTDAYMIPTAIYTKGRLVSEKNSVSDNGETIIEMYYKKYRDKIKGNKFVDKNIKMSAMLLKFGVYKFVRNFKKYLRK